jgi:hypothetical protein
MSTHEFLAHLAQHAEQPLAFSSDRTQVPPGYHVTEIKAVSVNAMDCGGQASSWNETVLQLWPPAGPSDATPMSVGKFLAIYRRVTASLPLDDDALVRVEYGAVGESAISYLVTAVTVSADGVDVHLAAPAVACKGADRSVGDVPVLERIGPGAPLAAATSRATFQGDGGCCGPASGGSRT